MADIQVADDRGISGLPRTSKNFAVYTQKSQKFEYLPLKNSSIWKGSITKCFILFDSKSFRRYGTIRRKNNNLPKSAKIISRHFFSKALLKMPL